MNFKSRVLIVDDDPVNIEILEEVLSDEFDVCTASSGSEAFVSAMTFRPDIILLDIMMPGIDGYEVCRRVRASEGISQVKIVLVSAKAMTEERLRGYEAGADDYLTKPFDLQELLAKVRVYLRFRSEEELNFLRADLLNLVSREIQGPLEEITEAATLLQAGDGASVEDRQAACDAIARHGRRLRELTRRSSALSELRPAGSRAARGDEVDVTKLCKSVIEEARDYCSSLGVTLAIDSDGSLPIEGDEPCLRLALALAVESVANVASSAGAVRMHLQAQSDSVQFRISSASGSTPSEEVARILGGTPGPDGLIDASPVPGLALAREIVAAHGGALGALSGDSTEIGLEGSLATKRPV